MGSTGYRRTTDFVETIVQLRPLATLGMHDSDFSHAYKIAGNRFTGSMQEFFLVLLDCSPSNPSLNPAAPAPLPVTGQKRNPNERDQDCELMDTFPSAKSSRSESSVASAMPSVAPSVSASVSRRLQTTHVTAPINF